MEMLNLKEEKLKYNSMTQKLSRAQIKNHLIELGKNLESKDDLLVQTIIQTFVKKIIIYKSSITINTRFFPSLDMANDGGSDGNRTRVRNCQRHRLLQA